MPWNRLSAGGANAELSLADLQQTLADGSRVYFLGIIDPTASFQQAEIITNALNSRFHKFIGIIRERDDVDHYEDLERFMAAGGGEVLHADLIQKFRYTIGQRNMIMPFVETLLDGRWKKCKKGGKSAYKVDTS